MNFILDGVRLMTMFSSSPHAFVRKLGHVGVPPARTPRAGWTRDRFPKPKVVKRTPDDKLERAFHWDVTATTV
jgi:hypothetical protein